MTRPWVVWMAGLAALVAAVFVGAGRAWGAVALAVVGMALVTVGVSAALGDDGRAGR